MSECAKCNTYLPGRSLICGACFSKWSEEKGKTLEEFLARKYKPEPKKIVPGMGVVADPPPGYEDSDL